MFGRKPMLTVGKTVYLAFLDSGESEVHLTQIIMLNPAQDNGLEGESLVLDTSKPILLSQNKLNHIQSDIENVITRVCVSSKVRNQRLLPVLEDDPAQVYISVINKGGSWQSGPWIPLAVGAISTKASSLRRLML
jgi:hypothetical protein